MKKIVLSLITTAILGFASTVTIEGFSSPESTIVNKSDLYVSNVGKELKLTLKDGDGFISKLDVNGKIKELHFIDGLDAPKGMEIVGNTLFVADINTLRGFDLETKKEVFNVVFEGVNFLNDITVKDSNTLFIGASDTSAIYEVNISNKSYKKFIDFTVANGLFYEDGILYAAQLGTFEGILDGVHKFENKVYVSDWGNGKDTGMVRVYDLKTKEETILKHQFFMGSADFWIDEKSKKIFMPQMIGGK